MNFQRLLDQLKHDEGFSYEPYKCTRGVFTIGYGTTRINDDVVTEYTPPIPETEASNLLKADAYEACIAAQGIFGDFGYLTPLRQEVLVNMAYNLGASGLARFTKMNAAILDRDWKRAAAEMKDSKWYRQVGNRAVRLTEQMGRGW